MAESLLRNRDGIDTYLLQSREVEMEVVPALGGKITSLRSRRTGREWMWSPPYAHLFRNELEDPFAASTLIGADECFPTIGACRWMSRDLPDHGEVWSRPWEVDATTNDLTLSIRCPISPFILHRHIHLQENKATFSYELKNEGSSEESYLWAFHPLFAIEPGDCIEVPTSSVRVDLAIGCPFEGWEKRWDWPRLQPEVRLDKLNFGSFKNAAAKVFAESLEKGATALYNDTTGERLEMTFDPAEIDTLGVWINRGGWNGFHHVALEPTNGAPDRLDVAGGKSGRCRRLAAGATARWNFSIILY